jgi:hypothetical protein
MAPDAGSSVGLQAKLWKTSRVRTPEASRFDRAAISAERPGELQKYSCLVGQSNAWHFDGRIEQDFDKGISEGADASLRVIYLTADRWHRTNAS